MFTVNTMLSATASEIHKKYNCVCVRVWKGIAKSTFKTKIYIK